MTLYEIIQNDPDFVSEIFLRLHARISERNLWYLYTCIHADGRNHQLRYVKLFQTWDIFPHQPPSNLPATCFFPCWLQCNHYLQAEIPRQNHTPGMRMHGSRGETGSEWNSPSAFFLPEKNGCKTWILERMFTYVYHYWIGFCLIFFVFSYMVFFVILYEYTCIYPLCFILLTCSSLLICCWLKGSQHILVTFFQGFIMDSFITIWQELFWNFCQTIAVWPDSHPRKLLKDLRWQCPTDAKETFPIQ